MKAERTEKRPKKGKRIDKEASAPSLPSPMSWVGAEQRPRKKKIENSTPFDCCVPRKGAAQARGVQFRSRTGEERGGPWSVKEKNSRPRDPGADA